jgi:hypothetical protein
MMGEREAVIQDVSTVSIHGMPYVDVTLRFEDGTSDTSRLGPEAVPHDLQPGEAVQATVVANIVVSLRRA